MTNRQTLPDLLARLTEDRHTAEVDSLRRVIAEERARADRLLAEASNLREMLDDAIESLELLVPVPAPAIGPVAAPTSSAACVPPDERQVANRDGFYSHQGQLMPWCFLSERVVVCFRDGSRWAGVAGNIGWAHHDEPKDVVWWRPESAPVGNEGVSMQDALGWHRRYYTGAAGYPTGSMRVDYQRRNGMFGRNDAALLNWTMTGGDDDIVRWRITPDHTEKKETSP